MRLYSFASASINRTVYLRAHDRATGAPKTDLLFSTAGLTISYYPNEGALVGIPLVTQTAAGVHADGGCVHVGGGDYRLDLPDAAVATSNRWEIIAVLTDVIFEPVQYVTPAFDPLAAGADAATIADAVLDELLAGHVAAGSAGKALGDILDANQLKFTYDAGTGVLTVFRADGVTVLFTRTLTLEARNAVKAAT